MRRSRRCRASSASPYAEVDITDDAELEARYREWLPVVEIDGERAFVYYVDEAALRRKLAADALYVARETAICASSRPRRPRPVLGPELGFAVDEIEITGVPELEQRYRDGCP